VETERNFNFVVKLTTNCPANCKCCANRKREFKLKNENNKIFDISIFEKICINIKKVGGHYVCLSGGEPTMVSNIEEYLKIAHDNGLAIRMNTNGWEITEEKLTKWLSLGLEQIVLSVYSLNKITTKNIRGNEILFNKVINAAKVIKNLKPKNNFTFIVQTVIMRENYKEMADLLDFAIKHEADFFWPSYLEDAINLLEIRMPKEDIVNFKNEVIPQMKSVVEKSVFSTEHKEHLKKCINNLYKDEFDGYIYHKEDFNCYWLRNHLTFYPNGTIYPCPAHEYFSSKNQYKLDYSLIDDFLTIENLNKNINSKSIHYRYCPQGVYQELKLRS